MKARSILQKEFYMWMFALSNSDKNRDSWIRKFIKYLIKIIKIIPIDFTTVETIYQISRIFEDVKLF